MRLTIVAAVFLMASAVHAADNDAQGLADAAKGFYDTYMAVHPLDTPDAKARARFAPFVSPALENLLAQADDASTRYIKATKNMAPPLFEGDIFTSLFEGATSYKIGRCVADKNGGGHCAIVLTYDDHRGKPAVWTDTVYLVRTPSGLRVDDIAYGGTWDFADKGRLTQTLSGVIHDADDYTK